MIPKFRITERDLGFISDNSINYRAGPIKFEVQPTGFIIVITSLVDYDDLLLELLPIIKNAWDLVDEDIIYKDSFKIIIKYNLQIISNYLFYSIILL